MKQLTVLAKEKYNCSVGQLAIAWCLKNKHVSTVLLGATKPTQLIENIQALAVARQMTDSDKAEIDAILGNSPDVVNNARSITSLEK